MVSPRRRQRRRPWYSELIDDHDPIEGLVERVLDTEPVQNLIGSFEELLDRAANAIDPRAVPGPSRSSSPAGNRTPPRRAAPPPRRPPPPPPVAKEDPRAVLHFGPDERLTKEMVTQRRRALAALCHPDKGGSLAAMQKVNQAADELLRGL